MLSSFWWQQKEHLHTGNIFSRLTCLSSRTRPLPSGHTCQQLPVQQPGCRPGGTVPVRRCPVPCGKLEVCSAETLVQKQVTESRYVPPECDSLRHFEELRASAPHQGGGAVSGLLLQPPAIHCRHQHGGSPDTIHQQLWRWHQKPAHGRRETAVRDEGCWVPRDWWVLLLTTRGCCCQIVMTKKTT